MKRKYVRKNKDAYQNKDTKTVQALQLAGLNTHYKQRSLNSIANQLNISPFEGYLLHFFHEVFLKSMLSRAPSQKLWLSEIPRLWHRSEWLRRCMFSTSVMFIGNSSDISKRINQHLGNDSTFSHNMVFDGDRTKLGLSLPSIHNIIHQDGYLEVTNAYFQDALTKSKEHVKQSLLGKKINSEFQAAEFFFTGVLLTITLILHPKKLYPLVIFDKKGVDLIQIFKGVKLLMGESFPLLYIGKYSTIFEFPRLDPYAVYLKKIPLIEVLRDNLRLYSNELSKEEQETYSDAIDVLLTIIHNIIEFNSLSPLTSWIFLVQDELYDYLKIQKTYFAMKLVYIYSCLCLMSRICLEKKSSVFYDFMQCYRDFNYESFGNWRDNEDYCFYSIIMENFEMEDYGILNYFLPSRILSELPKYSS